MHTSKSAVLLALLLAICLCLSACTGKQSDPENADILLPSPETSAENQFIGEASTPEQLEITLHYASENSLSLGSTARIVSLARNENPVHASLRELSSAAALNGAAMADILDVEIGSGVVTVNLAIDAGVNRSQQDYLLLCASIANTLLELEDVNAVNLLTGGYSASLCGLPMGVFTQVQDNIAALYAQVQTESERFPSAGASSLSRNALLYFPSAGSDYFLPEIQEIRFDDDDYVSAILNALCDGPLMHSCSFTPIPGNMDLLQQDPVVFITESGERIIELHFNPVLDSYLAFSEMQPAQMYGSLVLSLCSFVPEIDGVRIFLGDEPVEQCELNGQTLQFENSLMRRQDFSPTIGASTEIYFANAEGSLVRSEIALSQSAAQSPLQLLRHFIAAEAPEGLSSVFPEGVRSEDILGVRAENRIAEVNLSANLYARCQSLSPLQERLLIYGMVNALTQLDGIGAVSFRVEGRQAECLAHDIYLKTPLLPDHGIIAAAQ